MKNLIFTILCCSALTASATTQVTLTTEGGSKFVTSTGTIAPVGTVIRVGQFDLAGGNADVIRNSLVFGDIDALFTPFAEGRGSAGAIDQENNAGSVLVVNDQGDVRGETRGFVQNIDNSYFAAGTPIHIWVLDSEVNPTEWGIFASSDWLNRDPAFPGFPAPVNVQTSSVNVEALQGEVSAAGLQLATVPEPSSAGLIALAGLGLIARRRR